MAASLRGCRNVLLSCRVPPHPVAEIIWSRSLTERIGIGRDNNMSSTDSSSKCNGSSSNNNPTAGIIIIGDEVIKGQVRDTNGHFLCQRLHRLGVHVERISVIRDNVDTISREVATFSRTFDYVLTSGGIGPTHDDMTFEGVAKAFGDKIHQHPTLTELVKKFFVNADDGSPAMRLAQIPTSAKLNFVVNKQKGTKNPYPLVSVGNVYVFPGVPHLLERIFDHLGEEIFGNAGHRPHCSEVYLADTEVNITPVLNAAVDKFKDRVVFGSYPEMQHSYYKVRITMEGRNDQDVSDARQYFHDNLKVIDYVKDPVSRAVDAVYALSRSESNLAPLVRRSVEVLERCFRKHSVTDVCLSFNGGKDCTVLLHLVLAVMRKSLPDWNGSLTTLYVRDEFPFPDLEAFVHESAVRYNLDVLTLNSPIKSSLVKLKETRPAVTVAIMGTRRTDPYCERLEAFQPTDPDWPPLLRVSPILDWTYSDVWQFVRELYLPYCLLYDRGFTSIGNMRNTLPNPALQFVDERGAVQYRPAYELEQDDQERKGRK